ncbi:alpha/beta fold hydrolase [Janibacter cremeus]|uniref:Pimeloyl-ACP methyl ester carboxylesterase/predicted glycosyltransferase n=1 Tax=Janibacter cremeus TaxID=1285192 RepID=A0A852W1C0_9MICO|nr:alpha/beta fold hydrolase [Janibacter cremeus]NYF99441.1 pimeloyl-ACP methyl ester carboxylesterase/predicted glycosyltransferase [Janibacter cremeus]
MSRAHAVHSSAAPLRVPLPVPGEEPRTCSPPHTTGSVVRDGVRIPYAVHGSGEVTVLLLPTWSLVPSRWWKAQVPYLARHLRVVTFDGRGSGDADRPAGSPGYADEQYAADAVAVLDATETERAVVVGYSCGATWSIHLAATLPDRVQAIVAIGPSCGLRVATPDRERFGWEAQLDTTQGWAKYNRDYWLGGGYDDFIDFFAHQIFTEPHSTKQVEDVVRWGHQISPQTLVDTTAGRLGRDGAVKVALEPLCAQVRCPVLVVHGTEDAVRPPAVGERLAQLTGGDLVLVTGGGHGLPGRDPVRINQLIKDFAQDSAAPSPPVRRTWTRAQSRPTKVLYLSSPIGLGHCRRDMAIAAALRGQHPELQIDWLTQDPVTRVLQEAGERVHPASEWLGSESRHLEDESADHDLHAFHAIRRMDEIQVNNFMVFADVVEEGDYDLVVGDEAWDVDYFLHENPELKRFPFAWLTDFVGWVPMPDGGEHEVALTADYNAEMIEQRARFGRVRDASVFVGTPDDVVDLPFGPGLPGIREWTEANFDFAGYVTGFVPPTDDERAAARRRLGCRDDELLCVVTVGGSGVGESLLRRVLDAVPLARRRIPGLRFLVVTGPRIDPETLPRRRGVSYRGYVPDLYRQLAACDLAVVQGGLTTCMELAASHRPFIYVPLQHHFEQNVHVRHRLERYGAGTCMDYAQACDPDALVTAMVEELGRVTHGLDVETDGAVRAAAMLAKLL